MSEVPLSGWSTGDYSLPDPKENIELLYEDLKELKHNLLLVSSPSWLAMFAKNAHDLDHSLDQMSEHPHFSHNLMAIRNWFKNALEEGKSFSNVLFETKESHYKNFKSLKHFLDYFLQKDKKGLNNLVHLFEEYLKPKD